MNNIKQKIRELYEELQRVSDNKKQENEQEIKSYVRQIVNDNQKIAKPLMMIAVGLNKRSQIIEEVKATTWDNNYRSQLLKEYIDKKTKEKKIGAYFIEEVEHSDKNKAKYILDYNIFISMLKDLMINDIKANESSIIIAKKRIQVKFEKENKKLKTFKKAALNDSGSKIIKDAWGTKFENENTNTQISLKIMQLYNYKNLEEEYNYFLKELNEFLKFVEEKFNSLETNKNIGNWLICHMIQYFREVLYSREKTLSMNEELRNWLLAINFKGFVNDVITYEDYKNFPFDKKESYKDTFMKICQGYNLYKNMNIEWLNLIKPNRQKELKEQVIAHEQDIKDEEQRMVNYYQENTEEIPEFKDEDNEQNKQNLQDIT